MAEKSTSSLEERLDLAEARFAIAELIHGYARFIRYDTPEQVSALFTPDGVFEVRDGHPDRPEYSVRSRLEGREQIDAYMLGGKGKPHPIPLIHNLMIEVEGESASANCVMEAQIFGTEHKVFGEYRDRFQRMEGRWLFASRSYTIFSAASSI